MKNNSNLEALEKKKNRAREKLYQIMDENKHEWEFARKLLRSYESQFLKLWEAYQTDPHYIENEFYTCCNNLHHYIYQEQLMDKEFKKTYGPYRDEFQKLNKEYNLLKNKLKTKSKKSVKK